MSHVLMINFLMIMEKAVRTLGSISLHDKKIKSNNYQFLCVLRLINILLLFLLRHLNWIDTRGVQYVMKTAQYIPKFYIYTLNSYFH